MDEIFFSLIITAYNVENYIEECVDSILKQTYSNIEVIIVDDGSMDETGRKCDIYLQRDRRVKVIHQENQGVVVARKTGINHSLGKYLIFIDGDDWVDKELCEQYARILEESGAEIVLSGLLKDYVNSSSRVKNNLPSGYYDEEKIIKEIYPKMMYTGNFYEKGLESYICGRAVKREILEAVMDSIENKMSFGEGGVWLFSCMFKVKSAIITDDMFYHYRMRSDSMSIQDETSDKILRVYENLLRNIKKEKKNVEQFIWQLDYMAVYLFIWKKPDVFDIDGNSFYFLSKLKKEDKIVLYGAWRFGQIMKSYIEKNGLCDIALWVDKNADEYREKGWNVERPEKIAEIEYDYIVLATGVYSVMQSMRMTLKQMGVTKNILALDENVMGRESLPDDIKKIKQKYL